MFRLNQLRPVANAATSSSAALRTFSSTAARRNFARLTLVGRLGAEPELSTSANGRELIKYSIGTNRGPKDNKQTSWFKITSFTPEGPGRDHLLGLPKGTLMLVEGDASIRVFEDNEGKKSSTLGVIQRTYDVLKRGTPQE